MPIGAFFGVTANWISTDADCGGQCLHWQDFCRGEPPALGREKAIPFWLRAWQLDGLTRTGLHGLVVRIAQSALSRRTSCPLIVQHFAREEIDVAIRHGEGQWPGLHVTRLGSEELVPVCSPKLLRGRHALRSPDDLKRHTLLHLNDQRDWLKWLNTAGIADADLSHGTVFNQASMAIDAAVNAQGIALARTALTAWDLRAGRLVRPFDLALSLPYAYWIVCPRVNADLPKVATFRHWLLAQAEKDADELTQPNRRSGARASPTVRRPSRPRSE